MEYDPFRKKYRAKETPLSKPLPEFFDLKRVNIESPPSHPSSPAGLLLSLGDVLPPPGMGGDFTASP
ncbi:MAG: hypothetical protein QXG22_04280 [Candidatus Hadarchaeales archaeon]